MIRSESPLIQIDGREQPNPAQNNLADQQLRKVAQQFESVFLTQFLSGLTSGLQPEEGFSLGGSDPYSSMLRDQYADLIAQRGGVGIADSVLRELLQLQEGQ